MNVQYAHSQDSAQLSHALYHEYEGSYDLGEGKFITGALMDEIEGHMLFMEPLTVSTGGLFRPVSRTTFQSLPPDDIQISFSINDEGDVEGLWWKKSENDSIFAEKVSPHSVEHVTFKNSEVVLSGELLLPKVKGPHPVVINVHGSGKGTRHMGPWNTFLLKYGIAVLSYDKRGAGQSTGDFDIAGYKDFAGDVMAAIDFVKGHPEIDAAKIGLHGSSEGGWVSSIAASKSEDLEFMIIRAGSGVSGGDNYMYEVKNGLMDRNLSDAEYRSVVQFEREVQYLAEKDASMEDVNSFIDSERDKEWFQKIYDNWNGIGGKRWIKMKKTGPIDPAVYLRMVTDIPVLWFLAEEDENVPYEISRVRINEALTEAGNRNFEIVTLPGANHAFFVSTPEGNIKYTDGYWDKMISWLKERKIIP